MCIVKQQPLYCLRNYMNGLFLQIHMFRSIDPSLHPTGCMPWGCMPWIILHLWRFLCVRDTGHRDWKITALGVSIFFSLSLESWSRGRAVSQRLEFTILYPSNLIMMMMITVKMMMMTILMLITLLRLCYFIEHKLMEFKIMAVVHFTDFLPQRINCWYVAAVTKVTIHCVQHRWWTLQKNWAGSVRLVVSFVWSRNYLQANATSQEPCSGFLDHNVISFILVRLSLSPSVIYLGLLAFRKSPSNWERHLTAGQSCVILGLCQLKETCLHPQVSDFVPVSNVY